MSRVITFSRFFPAKHPRKGESTYFMERIWKELQTGNHRDGEYTVWSNYPRLMKDGHWQLPHLWRDKMNDKNFIAKFHTIRAGNRWKVGDKFSPRVWSGLPYQSKQIQFAPDIEIKNIWTYETDILGVPSVNGFYLPEKINDTDAWELLAKNDGLSLDDFISWFNCHPKKNKEDKSFSGQILCWNENINY